MAKVECEVNYIELENDSGRTIPSIEVTCSKCGNTAEAFGTSSRSIKRCLAQLRETCPEGENNFYVAEELEDLEDLEEHDSDPIDQSEDGIPF